MKNDVITHVTPHTNEGTQFKRKARIGISPLSCNEKNHRVMIEVKSKDIEIFTKKNGKTIDFVNVINLETGEEQTMWLSGQIKYNLNQILKARKSLTGAKLEIQWKGCETVEMDGEDVEVNQYEMFELEN